MVYEKIRKSKLKCNMATESVPDTRDEHVRVTLAYAYLFTVLGAQSDPDVRHNGSTFLKGKFFNHLLWGSHMHIFRNRVIEINTVLPACFGTKKNN